MAPQLPPAPRSMLWLCCSVVSRVCVGWVCEILLLLRSRALANVSFRFLWRWYTAKGFFQECVELWISLYYVPVFMRVEFLLCVAGHCGRV